MLVAGVPKPSFPLALVKLKLSVQALMGGQLDMMLLLLLNPILSSRSRVGPDHKSNATIHASNSNVKSVMDSQNKSRIT